MLARENIFVYNTNRRISARAALVVLQVLRPCHLLVAIARPIRPSSSLYAMNRMPCPGADR